ncbi:MAG: nucleotide exchange factor GrpE [Actinomycetota bacterium]
MTDVGEPEGDERERPRVKVTDRRRIRPGDVPAAAGPLAQDPPEPDDAGEPDELAVALRQAQEYRELAQRLQADFDNYRKRVVKEQTRAVEMAAEPFVRRLLEVLDDFDLALLSVGEDDATDADRFVKGVELVYAKLIDALRGEGLERIEAEGKLFDPNEHEALMQTGDGDSEPVVTEVFRQGYRLNGKVLRPAQVRVTRE